MNSEPEHYVSADDLSLAWGLAFLAVSSQATVRPLIVGVKANAEGRISETKALRHALDIQLTSKGEKSSQTTANTIFPWSYWVKSEPRQDLYKRYVEAYPRISQASKANQYGTYFQRMISYGPSCYNQLEYIISAWNGGLRRRSAFQILISEPSTDNTRQPRRGFPCLSQISLSHDDAASLTLTAYYPVHHIFTRAYGNYLGLIRLGRFIAHETGRVLKRVDVIAASACRAAPHTRTVTSALKPIIEDALKGGDHGGLS